MALGYLLTPVATHEAAADGEKTADMYMLFDSQNETTRGDLSPCGFPKISQRTCLSAALKTCERHQ